jgi:hypothetical protein
MKLVLIRNHQFSILELFIFSVILIYGILKGIAGGMDINVYLHASRQLFEEVNFYQNNPYNEYLYSPTFAFLLRPLSILPLEVGRSIWIALNILLAFRLFKLFWSQLDFSSFSDKQKYIFGLLVFIAGFGFLNHNLILGQISVFILWLSFEGLYQSEVKNRPIIGGLLIALGTNIKIIPILTIYYLFVVKSYRAFIWSLLFSVILLLLPMLYFESSFVVDMTLFWMEKINPQSAKYVIENDGGTVSLNSFLASYLYFPNDQFPRQIMSMKMEYLQLLIKGFQVLIALLILVPFLRKGNSTQTKFWQWNFIWVATLLIFPHQQQYALVYLLPAFFWMLFSFQRAQLDGSLKVLLYGLLICYLISGLLGRDVLGSTIVDFFNYYKWNSIVCLFTLVGLFYLNPKKVGA